MTYFITAKQIVEYEAESERPISQKERITNGKRTKYPLFFENRNTQSTGKRSALNPGERACNKPNDIVLALNMRNFLLFAGRF